MTPAASDRLPTELAYMAGIIDGEGCIRIGTYLRKSTTGNYLKTQAAIEISNTDIRMLRWVSERFGGHVRPKSHQNPKGKPAFTWQCGGREGHDILTKILPYLVIKKDQAECFVSFVELRSSGKQWSRRGLDPKEEETRNAFADKMHRLNRKGLSAVVNE